MHPHKARGRGSYKRGKDDYDRHPRYHKRPRYVHEETEQRQPDLREFISPHQSHNENRRPGRKHSIQPFDQNTNGIQAPSSSWHLEPESNNLSLKQNLSHTQGIYDEEDGPVTVSVDSSERTVHIDPKESPTIQDNDKSTGNDFHVKLITAVKEKRVLELIDLVASYKDSLGIAVTEACKAGSATSSNCTASMIKCLIDAGASLNVKDKRNDTPLLLVLENEMWETAKLLLQKGSSTKVENRHGDSPLSLLIRQASARGKSDECPDSQKARLEVIQLLVEKGALVNFLKEEADDSPLIWAAKHGYHELVSLLCEKGAHVYQKDASNGLTALSIASQSGDLNTVCNILRYCKDSLRQHDVLEAFQLSLEKGKDSCAQELCGQLASMKTVDKSSILRDFVLKGNIQALKLFSKVGKEMIYKHGPELLGLALDQRLVDMLNLLVDIGVPINHKDTLGQTVLMKTKDPSMVEALLAKGADRFQVSNSGDTALSYATESLNMPLVKALLNTSYPDTHLNRAIFSAVKNAECTDEMIDVLLEAGADINAKDRNGNTLLHIVAEQGSSNIFKRLLHHGCQLHASNDNGVSPFKLALQPSKSKEKSFVQSLLHYSQPNLLSDEDFGNLFLCAVRCGDLKKVGDLLKSSRNANQCLDNVLDNAIMELVKTSGSMDIAKLIFRENQTIKKDQMLLEAACENHLKLMTYLLQIGADPKYVDEHGRTAMLYGIDNGNEQMCKMLIRKGVNINELYLQNTPVLLAAVHEDNLQKTKFLLNLGADPNIRSEEDETALLYALKNNQMQMSKFLLKRNDVNVNVVDRDEEFPLGLAIKTEADTEIVSKLLDLGADINATDLRGKSSLRYAIEAENLELTRYLLEKNACVDTQCEQRMTPLMIATEKRNQKLVETLLHFGADCSKRNVRGDTAILHFLHQFSSHREDTSLPTILRLLVEHGADVNDRDKKGNSPLLLTISQGLNHCVDFLIEKGAHINYFSPDFDGKSALMFAAIAKDNHLLELLLKAGSEVNHRAFDGMTALSYAALLTLHPSDYGSESTNIYDFKRIQNALFENRIETKLSKFLSVFFDSSEPDKILKLDPDEKTALIRICSCIPGVDDMHCKTLKILLDAGAHTADTTLLQKEGNIVCVLCLAIDQLAVEKVKLLINYRSCADVDGHSHVQKALNVIRSFPRTCYSLAQIAGQPVPPTIIADLEKRGLEIVQVLCEESRNINTRGSDGKTALLMSLSSDEPFKKKIVQLLIAKGADVNVEEERTGDSPLIMYMKLRDTSPDIITDLVRNGGARINKKNKLGQTALVIAVETLDRSAIETLLDLDAEVNVLDGNGDTPLAILIRKNISKDLKHCIKVLLQKGARAMNVPQEIVQRCVRQAYDIELLPLLMACGVKPEKLMFGSEQELRSPLRLALLHGQATVARELVAKMYLTTTDLSEIHQEVVSPSCALTGETYDIARDLCSHPVSLSMMTFIVLSDKLGSGESRRRRVLEIVPNVQMQQRLLFE